MSEILYTILAAITFLIPGFITTSILKRVIPVKNKEYKTQIFENFIYSFLNMFLWSMLIYKIVIEFDWWKEHYVWLWVTTLLIIFLSPIGMALVIILLKDKDISRRFCEYFELSFVDTDPSAWDYKFKNIKSEWVLLTLSDGKNIAGYIGENSFMSSNIEERDLYIDEVYDLNSDGEWQRRNRTDGVWIKADEIKSIEFFKN